MADFRTINELSGLDGKVVLVRADLNVPMAGGTVTDDTRIRAVVPTVHALLEKGAKVVIMSHFGRPKGERRTDMSLKPVVRPLADALGTDVAFADDCIGDKAEHAIESADGVVLLENLRFHAGEEANDPDFAAQLAALGDMYVDDAFSAAHRAHASVEAITHRLPSAVGLSMAGEINALETALSRPDRPLAAIVGGAKISTKIAVLGHLLDRVDHLIIGGGMANTFLAAQGTDIGKSLCEHDRLDEARAILDKAEKADCLIHLPRDAVLAATLAEHTPTRTAPVTDVRPDEMILDIGPSTLTALKDLLDGCRTLVWNGPLGAFEVEPFDRATVTLAQEAAALSRAGKLVTVAGGGDTVAALNKAGVIGEFSHVSTAGGAFLEWLEGTILPGVAALRAHARTS